MKININYYLIISSLILFSNFAFSQDLQMPQIETEAFYIGEDSIPFAVTRSFPPHYLYRHDGYLFEIIMNIKFQDEKIFSDELFEVVYILSDGTTKKLSLLLNNIIKVSPQEYKYKFQIKLKNNDWVEIFLVQTNHSLMNNSFDNTSNKIKLYLSHK